MQSKLIVALQHHQAGQLQRAEALYREVLRDEPQNPDAIHLLGMIAHQLGRHEEAIKCIRQAIGLSPDFADYYNNLAMVQLELGDYEGGAASCREALRRKSDLPQAHSNLGNALQALGRFDEAAVSYERALRIDPNYAQAHANLGGLWRRLGRLDEAAASCQRALAIRPNVPEALNNLGDIYRAQGKPHEAIRCFEQALAVKPASADIHNNLGNAFKDIGRLDDAIACYQRASQIRPTFVQAHNNLAIVLRLQNRLDEAAASYSRALELNPHDAEVQNNLGEVQWQRGQMQEAMACFEQALALVPTFPTAHYNLGNVLRDQGELEDAATRYRAAVVHDAGFAAAWNNLALTLSEQGKCEKAFECFTRSLTINPLDSRVHSHVLVCQHYLPGVSLAKLARNHADWNERHAAPLKTHRQSPSNVPDPNRPLRVGFVSRDFRRHPVGYFLARVLESLDNAQYETICYFDQLNEDDMTHRLRSAAVSWRGIYGLSDEQLAARIRADAIDILLDLGGHTAANRLLTFARKPAPIQATWMGYVGTTGLDAIDYLFSDRFHTPVGVEAFYREEILRLPDGYICYDPPDDAPVVAPLPALASGRVTFGSFNNPAKVSPSAVALWARILDRVPESRLVLKYTGLDDQGAQRHFGGLFAAAGVAAERVEFLGTSPHQEMLGYYNKIDIALDPFPYSGGLTTCEALWMGVPVLTCPGDTFAGRHAFSHLFNAGLTDMVADDLNDCVERAINLAQHLSELADLRLHMRERVASSPLCDGPRFARGLEAAFRTIWRRWCESR